MQDMQAYLSNTIRTEYPVYEAELIALLTAVLEYTNDLSHLDPALASFVGQRMFCLRDLLAKTGAVLPLLCKTISAKDRFLALAGRADPADLALALAELRNSVGEVGETYALLDTFIKQNNVDEDKIQQVPAVTPAQTAAQKTRAKRKRGFTSKARVASETTEVGAAAATDKVVGNGGAITPHAANGSRRPTALSSVPNSARPRRPHPDIQIYESGPPLNHGAPKVLRRLRPIIANEYWSATPEKWDQLGDDGKRCFTHAGLICETEAGTIAQEPCSECAELGEVCEVYNTGDARNLSFGGACTRCRLNRHARYSHSEMKRTRKTQTL